MNRSFGGFGLAQIFSLIGLLFVAGVLSVLGYRLTPPGGPPTVRSRLLPRRPDPAALRPANLVLITIDGLRADRVGVYGPRGASVTRHIDALARDGFRFEQMVTASPSTFPAHAAMMTGLMPTITGAVSPIGGRLPESRGTLAEAIRAAGLRTAAFVGSGALGRPSGLERGFETFDAPRATHRPATLRSLVVRPAGEVIDAARAWADDNFRTRFFLWVQIADLLVSDRAPSSYRRLHDDPYDATLAYADAELGRLLNRLDSLGVLDHTIVVIASSHGVGLGEHGESAAGAYLYDSTVLVPVLMRVPHWAARHRSVPEQVRGIDLLPTLVELLDIDAGMRTQGTSLVPLLDPGGRLPALPAVVTTAYQEVFLGGSALEALRARGWKYIDGLTPELYDLRRDPEETRNLAPSQPDRVEDMRAALVEATGRGVIGGAREAPPEPRMLRLLESGLAELRRERTEIARKALADLGDRLDADHPGGGGATNGVPPAVLALLGAALRVDGHPEQALPVNERALRGLPVGGGFPGGRLLEGFLRAEVAACQEAMGDRNGAVASYRAALEIVPDDPGIRATLAGLLLERGDVADSITEYRAVLARAPGEADVLAGLGRALLRGGDAPAAAQWLRQAAQSAPSDPDVYLDLARASEELDRKAEAVRAYREFLARSEPARIEERRLAEERLKALERSAGTIP